MKVYVEQPPIAIEESVVPATVEAGSPNLLRLAYTAEFIFALQAALYVWTQIGGQAHLDMMPWYLKGACAVAAAWCCVKFTAAYVRDSSGFSRKTRLWLASVLLISVTMAGITYYYHAHEVPDEPDTDETTAKSVRNLTAGKAVLVA